MPYFRCTFIDIKGHVSKRDVFASNREELTAANTGEREEKLVSAQRMFGVNRSLIQLFARRIRHSDFLLFNQKLAVLLRAGTSLIHGLEVIVERMKKGGLKVIVNRALRDIRNGVQVSDALNDESLPHARIYRASLMAGERSGNLEEMLKRFNEYLSKVTQLRRKTISSLTYPVVLFFLMIIMVGVVMVFVIPRFSGFYDNFDAQLPGITRFFIDASLFAKANILLVIAVILAVVVAVRLVEKLYPQVSITDRIKIRFPFTGGIVLENALAVFSRTLSILIAGGVTVPDAVDVAVRGIENRWLYLQLRGVPGEIRAGRLLSDVLGEVKAMPAITSELLRVGDSSGNLTEVLDQNSEFLEASIDMKVASIISLIEPAIIVVLGMVIAFMLLSIYLPIFSAVQVVR